LTSPTIRSVAIAHLPALRICADGSPEAPGLDVTALALKRRLSAEPSLAGTGGPDLRRSAPQPHWRLPPCPCDGSFTYAAPLRCPHCGSTEERWTPTGERVWYD
jgi:hypothetical protein